MPGQLLLHNLLAHTARGSAETQRVPWNPGAWFIRASTHGLDWMHPLTLLQSKSELETARTLTLPRQAVKDLANRCPADFSPSDLLLASCIWGFGRHPRARARVQRMLETTNADAILREILDRSRLDGRDGFCALFERGYPRVVGLGVAFGTKFVYFAAGDKPAPQPLIYDRFVAAALRDLIPGEFPRADRHVSADAYNSYIELADSEARHHGIAPEDVEFGLFQHGKALSDS